MPSAHVNRHVPQMRPPCGDATSGPSGFLPQNPHASLASPSRISTSSTSVLLVESAPVPVRFRGCHAALGAATEARLVLLHVRLQPLLLGGIVRLESEAPAPEGVVALLAPTQDDH